MFVLYLILIAAVIGVGVAMTLLHKMHWTAFVATAAVTLLVPLPVNAIGLAIAKDDQQTFHEYWNGYETNAFTQEQTCQRDGVCLHTFQCDPYTVVETETYTDSKGKSQTRTVTRTKYHDCPYSTRETSFYVDSTLGTFTIASSLMTGEQFRWEQPIPGGQVLEAPALWREAKGRLEAGAPGPVTKVNSYKNFILNSESTLFKRYSGIIDELKAAGELPDITAGVTNVYQAQKLHFVGTLDGVDREALTRDLALLNGAVGTDLRADLHVVLVDADELSETPENYGNALLAHWQDPKAFGKDALGKNGLVLVAGVEGYKASPAPAAPTDATLPTPAPSAASENMAAPAPLPAPQLPAGTPVVKWAKAFTGMPVGNEALLQEISSELPGTSLQDNFFGAPSYNVSAGTVIPTEGKVESLLWGANKFERVSMTAQDAEDVGSGFTYLSDEWQPDAGTLTIIFILSSILAFGALIGGFFVTAHLRSNGTTDFVRYLFTKH